MGKLERERLGHGHHAEEHPTQAPTTAQHLALLTHAAPSTAEDGQRPRAAGDHETPREVLAGAGTARVRKRKPVLLRRLLCFPLDETVAPWRQPRKTHLFTPNPPLF